MNNGRIITRFGQNQATTPRETPRVQATIPTQLKLTLTSEAASNYTINKKGCISESPAYIYTQSPIYFVRKPTNLSPQVE